LAEISQSLAARHLTTDPLLILAMVMTLAGFGFKVAAVPFHLWAPDVYQGAPVPSAALIASASKVAGFFILAKMVLLGFSPPVVPAGSNQPGAAWFSLLAFLAVASMLLGNLAAIVQPGVRRLIAYSAVGHAGYMLLALMSRSSDGLTAILYYAITYALTVLGALGVVSIVLKSEGDDRITNFAGLSSRSPLMSFCMLVFMLSLAGIPPLAGFFGKFYVFAAALNSGSNQLWMLVLVAFAVGMSAVSLYYYLQVLKSIYVVAPQKGPEQSQVSPLTQVTVCLLAALVIILGCFPDFLIRYVAQSSWLPGS
jgi:NADH-quinone oxidoreductase subunit N